MRINPQGKNAKNILLIGALPPPVGGIAISFSLFVEEITKSNKHSFSVINISRHQRGTGLIRFAKISLKTILEVKKSQYVILSVSTPAISNYGLFILILTKLFGSKLIIRKGGGTDFYEYNKLKSMLTEIVLKKAYLYLAQTKKLVKIAKLNGFDNVIWFPTCRSSLKTDKKSIEAGIYNDRLKLVFLGQVKATKGVDTILRAAGEISPNVHIDIYGPLMWDYTEKELKGYKNIKYIGDINPEEINCVLSKYDALLLPTYHEGEGYPGVIIEALMSGLAIITTKWKEIPEIVNDKCGILIEPKNKTELVVAVNKLNNRKFLNGLKRGAIKQSKRFDINNWVTLLLNKHII